MSIAVKPYRGIVIDESGDAGSELAAALEDLDKDAYYIAVAAWADSFAEFNTHRNEIVNLGFEYRIIPAEPGGFIQEGGSVEAMIQ